MPREEYYKKMFFIGAIWNWVATLTFAIGWKFLFPLFGMAFPNYLVFYMMFLGLAFVYGIGYFWVSRDISRNHDIVRMGIIGKMIVFVSMLLAWIGGEIPIIVVGSGVVDLIFAILFIEFLMTCRKLEAHG
jgi:hypothetical protein